MKFAKVYDLLVQKAQRKNRTRQEVDEIICWMTGYGEEEIARLRESGVQGDHIDICETCTACCPTLYWSHRRTGDRRGVQGGLIGLPREGRA